MTLSVLELVIGAILISCQCVLSNICMDIINNPEHEYSLEEINRCHECPWLLLEDDVRSSAYESSVPGTSAGLSRLNDTNSAWCAANDNDYLEVAFSYQTKIGGFVISGFDGKWVETLKVYYEDEMGRTIFAKSLPDGSEIFQANTDDSSRVTQKFTMPIFTRLVRILPGESNSSPCLRIDFYSCEDMRTSLLPPTGVSSDPVPACSLNTRTDCGEVKCAKYKTDNTGCQICECDMVPGGVWESDIFLDERTINIAQVRLTNSDQPDGTYSAGARHAARFQDYPSNGKYLVYYTMAASFSGTEMRNFRAAFDHIAQKSCIQLTQMPRGRNIPYYIRFIRGGGCYSPVGKTRNGNQVSIGYGCGHLGIIVHEIMHSLGFWHEQSRPDRDNYVTINWSNIGSSVQYNFQKQAASQINSFNSPYDYNSLMHYGSTAFSTNGRQTITPRRAGVRLGQRSGLSTEDAKQLNAMYECHKLTGGKKTTARPATTTKTGGGTCVDENKSCGRWANRGECKKNPDYMLDKCKRSCGVCGGVTTREPTPTTTTTTTKKSGSCTDDNVSCKLWARRGECTKNPGYMLVRCKNSCGVCESGDCKDLNPYCRTWKRYCNGYTYRSVPQLCEKTCGLC